MFPPQVPLRTIFCGKRSGSVVCLHGSELHVVSFFSYALLISPPLPRSPLSPSASSVSASSSHTAAAPSSSSLLLMTYDAPARSLSWNCVAWSGRPYSVFHTQSLLAGTWFNARSVLAHSSTHLLRRVLHWNFLWLKLVFWVTINGRWKILWCKKMFLSWALFFIMYTFNFSNIFFHAFWFHSFCGFRGFLVTFLFWAVIFVKIKRNSFKMWTLGILLNPLWYMLQKLGSRLLTIACIS